MDNSEEGVRETRTALVEQVLAMVDKYRETPFRSIEWLGDNLASMIAALSQPAPRIESALNGYRVAVSWAGADSWDGCSDCIDILRAARTADVDWDWPGDSNRIAAELAKITPFRTHGLKQTHHPAPRIDREAIKEALQDAYIAGASDVHRFVQDGGEIPRGDPEFGEAASDYAIAALDPFSSAARVPLALLPNETDDAPMAFAAASEPDSGPPWG